MILTSIKNRLKNLFIKKQFTAPVDAYNIWANIYDDQPGNLVFNLDEKIIDTFLNTTNISNKIIVDVGCGTGRHWNQFFSKQPAELIGYDVSENMLQKLQEKFPTSKTFLLQNNNLSKTPDAFCDILISTLVIAHIENLEDAFKEWNRVLKKDGEIFITDFHPSALENGATRSFRYKHQMIHIRNYIYSIDDIRSLAKKLNWQEINFIEKTINEDVKHFFKGEEAIEVYHNNINKPLVYGLHYKKRN